MARYFTSDHHFYHKNILKYQAPHRPFKTVEEMNEVLITRWNQHVTPQDEVYYLGDFAFTSSLDKSKELLQRLHGRKYLIQGNHDPKHLDEYGFEWMQPHHHLTLIDSAGRIDPSLEVYLSHYPYVEPSLLYMNPNDVVCFDNHLGISIHSLFPIPLEDDVVNP